MRILQPASTSHWRINWWINLELLELVEPVEPGALMGLDKACVDGGFMVGLWWFYGSSPCCKQHIVIKNAGSLSETDDSTILNSSWFNVYIIGMIKGVLSVSKIRVQHRNGHLMPYCCENDDCSWIGNDDQTVDGGCF